MSVVYVIIGAIIVGLIVGALARLIVPGTKGMSIVMTILLGIAGALVGGFVYQLFGGKDTSGVDWILHLVQLGVAVVFVFIYTRVARKKT